MTKTNEERIEEFTDKFCFSIVKPIHLDDHVDAEEALDWLRTLLTEKDKEREEAVAEMVEEVNRSWREDPMTVEHHAKIIAEAVEAEREQFIALVRSEMIKYPDSERIVEDPYNFALMCLENKLNKKQSELDQPNK